MCDVMSTGTIASNCMNGCRHLCSNLERCPNAVEYSTSLIARLCDLHTAFCRYCAKPFCVSCIDQHQEECAAKRSQVSTVAELVERAMGRMRM